MLINTRYNTELFGLTSLFELDATRLLKHETTPFAGQATQSLLGYITEDQGSYTKWRANLGMSVKADTWSAHYAMRYIGTAVDVNGGGPIGSAVPSIIYNDIQGRYFISQNTSLSMGIDNIFDKKAPFLTSWNDANTDVMTYDLLGRRGYLKLNINF